MSDSESTPTSVRWARLRFAIIAPLLASPPEHGELGARIAELASRQWKHPTTGDMERFGHKTIERWYYVAKAASGDPVMALARKVPSHAGKHPGIGHALARDPCAARGAPAMDLPAPPRQPRGAREGASGDRAGALVPDGASVHEGGGPLSAEEESGSPDVVVGAG